MEAVKWKKKLEQGRAPSSNETEADQVVLRNSKRRPQSKPPKAPKPYALRSKVRPPSINGHIYNPKTRVFMPEFGTVSTVRVDNTLKTVDVLQLLLSKFRIENDPKEFMLYVVKSSGETYPLSDADLPLFVRLRLGPCHDESQVFIMERDSVQTIGEEVAMLMQLPMPMLERMRTESEEKEKQEERNIRDRMQGYRDVLLKVLRERE